MRPKSLLLLALALGCGLVASIGISQVMEKGNQGPQQATVPIYVAKHNINIGDPMTAEMVMLKDWPANDVPTGAVRELAELEDRRPRMPLFAGEPILDGKLLGAGDKAADPTNSIPKGYRAVPISVKADTGGAGLLRAGDRVDVHWYVARNPSRGIEQTKSLTILHNVRIFAIDQQVVRHEEGEDAPALAKTISLLLTSRQANKVQLASKLGDVSLIPRNPDDPVSEEAAEVTYEELVQQEKNKRSEEQNRDEEPSGPGFLQGLLARATSGMANGSAASFVPVAKPFEMEIILNEDVETRLFDPESGKPIRDDATGGLGGYGAISTTGALGGAGGFSPAESFPQGLPLPATDSNESTSYEALDELMEEDFPIDFQQNPE